MRQRKPRSILEIIVVSPAAWSLLIDWEGDFGTSPTYCSFQEARPSVARKIGQIVRMNIVALCAGFSDARGMNLSTRSITGVGEAPMDEIAVRKGSVCRRELTSAPFADAANDATQNEAIGASLTPTARPKPHRRRPLPTASRLLCEVPVENYASVRCWGDRRH